MLLLTPNPANQCNCKALIIRATCWGGPYFRGQEGSRIMEDKCQHESEVKGKKEKRVTTGLVLNSTLGTAQGTGMGNTKRAPSFCTESENPTIMFSHHEPVIMSHIFKGWLFCKLGTEWLDQMSANVCKPLNFKAWWLLQKRCHGFR